jgi:hypothetical protein
MIRAPAAPGNPARITCPAGAKIRLLRKPFAGIFFTKRQRRKSNIVLHRAFLDAAMTPI